MPLPNELIGQWIIDSSGRVVADDTEKRIGELVENQFTRIDHREGGWTILYRDPSEGSYWELTCPHSDWHGGGPRKLTRIRPEELPNLYPSLNFG